jgi:hypothetical protein
VWRTHFSHYTPILDFVHVLSYVYAAAHVGRTADERWLCYARWAQWVWEGKVARVIEELQEQQAAGGEPQDGDAAHSPRQQTATTLGYLQNQQQRMRYDEYRRQGLPRPGGRLPQRDQPSPKILDPTPSAAIKQPAKITN